MNKLLISTSIAALAATTSVFAADLPRKAQPPVFAEPAPTFNWTGFYVGANLGYGQSRDKAKTRAIDPADRVVLTLLNIEKSKLNGSGILGGVQAGYNYQLTPGSGVVLGVEADAQYAGLSKHRRRSFTNTGTSTTTPVYTFSDVLTSNQKDELSYLGTLRARIGYGFDRVLVYGTGGLAYGDVKYRSTLSELYSVTPTGGVTTSSFGALQSKLSRFQTGYAYGAGIEYAIPTDSFLNFFRASALTLKAEYLHYDLGSHTVKPSAATAPFVTKLTNEGDVFRAGLNYKFGVF